jgi:hypothetical protein
VVVADLDGGGGEPPADLGRWEAGSNRRSSGAPAPRWVARKRGERREGGQLRCLGLGVGRSRGSADGCAPTRTLDAASCLT